MVAERRRPLAPEEAREADLAARGRQQILAADHEVDALAVVVDGGGELVGPVAEPFANQDVTALLGRILFLRAENLVDECFNSGIHPHPPPDAVSQRQAPLTAPAGVAQFRRSEFDVLYLLPRAITRVDKPQRREDVHRFAIDRAALALADER